MRHGGGFVMHRYRAVVVVPTYDEAANIGTLIDQVALTAPYSEVLVVDDNSPDGTAVLVRCRPDFGTRVHLLCRPRKAGLGSAYRAGFAWALGRGYDRIAQMDADLSHPASRLPALFEALDDADVAVGSRYTQGGAVANWAASRRLLSKAGNTYVRLVLGTDIADNTAGYKAFRADALRAIRVLESESNGYAFQIENAWRAHLAGLRVAEVPITFTDREAGTSKMTGSIAREALLRVLLWRLTALRDVLTFLTVGAIGYVVDVSAFNVFRSLAPWSQWDPAIARTLAVAVAMCVTYTGNRFWTWRRNHAYGTSREVGLFVLCNLVGLACSVGCLVISHDLIGLHSRLADNISANVIGLAMGTAIRFATYRRYVFGKDKDTTNEPQKQAAELCVVPVACQRHQRRQVPRRRHADRRQPAVPGVCRAPSRRSHPEHTGACHGTRDRCSGTPGWTGDADMVLLGDRAETDDSVVDHDVHTALTQESVRLSRLVDDLLALARLGPARPAGAVDLDHVAFEEAQLLRARTDRSVDTRSVSACQVLGDPDLIARAIRNLLDNAARHSTNTVCIRTTVHGPVARIVVTDDGPGIPFAAHQRVLERFTRLDEARARDRGGVGLGLAIVNDVALLHGGQVSIEDNDPGARVTLSLPRTVLS